MIFLDEAVLEFRSGKGGSGAVSFHREKFVPKGGPDGADGGSGGDLILVADRGVRTLYELQRIGKFEADSGGHAVTHKRGKSGKNLEVKLPVGTLVFDEELGELAVDLNTHGMRFRLCRGGKGGKGNLHFANSVRQAPNFAQKGGASELVRARLELKLIADVGLVGLPNAGKSTLISQISAAKPKIADYPFTTLVPNLGVVYRDGKSFVVADTPGLIEGASRGVGLGHQFLRHVERNRVLVHVVDAFPIDGSDPIENYHVVENELRQYSSIVDGRPRLIALNKIDVLPPGAFGPLREAFEGLGRPLFPISAAIGQGLDSLVYAMLEVLEASPEVEAPHVYRPLGQDGSGRAWDAVKTASGFEVKGKRIVNLAAMTDLNNEEALYGFQRRLKRIGVFERLRELGATEGSTITIGEMEFEFNEDE